MRIACAHWHAHTSSDPTVSEEMGAEITEATTYGTLVSQKG